MIPPEPSQSYQPRSVSSSKHVEHSSCSSPPSVVMQSTDQSSANCPCCCRQRAPDDLDVARLRRLVPLRAGIRTRRLRRAVSRRGGTESIRTRRHCADRPTPGDGEPALPGDDRCVVASTSDICHDDDDDVIQRGTSASSADIPLPLDPRAWSRDDVRRWLRQVSLQFNMAVDADRFPMNGKALCLMNAAMFLYRVPRGGDRLYVDFQQRLLTALLTCRH